jgi:hypothetical protein
MLTDGRFGTTTVSDPITGEQTIFHGPDNEWLCAKHLELARRHQLIIREVNEVAQLLANIPIFGEAALQPGFTAFEATEQLKRDHEAAKWDTDRLSGAPMIDEVLAILERNQDRLLRLAEAEPDPAKRQRIEDFLIASAASLQGMYERAQARIAAKHRGLNG